MSTQPGPREQPDRRQQAGRPAGAVIVGAAILCEGRLLAARRTQPAEMAGGWEFPGGKVEPGESVAQACVREVREELGCEIEVVGDVPGEQPLRPGFVLRVLRARLVAGEPVPGEHDALRWLAPEELDTVRWLDADRPFVAALREPMLDGEPLPGGNVGGAVRIGPTVRRPTGPWTPSVHALLEHLSAAGVPAVPRVLGYDERGREVLSYLPGEVVYVPRRRLDDEQLADLMRWLRRFHDASRGFRSAGEMPWRFERRALADGEIVCHHDVGWYNLAFTGQRLTGVFDWDVAGPGVPLDDLAFSAWNDVPLVGLPRDVGEGHGDDGHGEGEHGEVAADIAADAAHRLRLMAKAYGDVDAADILAHVRPRIEASRRRITTAAQAGDPGMQRLLGTGVLDKIDQGLAAFDVARPAIVAALDATPG